MSIRILTNQIVYIIKYLIVIVFINQDTLSIIQILISIMKQNLIYLILVLINSLKNQIVYMFDLLNIQDIIQLINLLHPLFSFRYINLKFIKSFHSFK